MNYYAGKNSFVGSYLIKSGGYVGLDRSDFYEILNDPNYYLHNSSDTLFYGFVSYSNDTMVSEIVNTTLLKKIHSRNLFQKIIYISSIDTLNKKSCSTYLDNKRIAECYAVENQLSVLRLSYPIHYSLPKERMLRRIFEKLMRNEIVELYDFRVRLTPIKLIADYISNKNLSSEIINLTPKNTIYLSDTVRIMKDLIGSRSKIKIQEKNDLDPFLKFDHQLGNMDYNFEISDLTKIWLSEI